MKLVFTILVLSTTLSFSIKTSAQINFEEGYVITNTNDTIIGLINDGGGIKNSKVCLFKSSNESNTTKYLPNEIKAYRFLGDKYYEALQIKFKGENKWIFAEVLLKGSVNLYYYWKGKNDKYYIEKEDSTLLRLSNDNFQLKVKGVYGTDLYNKSYMMTFKVFRDSLYSFFKDCKKNQDKVDFVDYNHESLMNISKEYIAENCLDNGYINYEKDMNIIKPTYGVFTGIQLSKISFLESKLNAKIIGAEVPVFFSIPIGVFYNFPLMLINDNLSFQLELVTNSLDYSDFGDVTSMNFINHIHAITVGIPLLFKYVISKGKYSPTIAIGKETGFNFDSKVTRTYTGLEYEKNDYLLFMHYLPNDDFDRTQNYTSNEFLHVIQNGGWFFELGLNYKIRPEFSVFSNLRIQSTDNIIITDKYYNRFTYNTNVKKNSFAEMFETYSAALQFGIKF